MMHEPEARPIAAGRFRGAVSAAITDGDRRRRFWEGFFDGPVAAKVLNGDEPGVPAYVNTCYSIVGKDYGISVAAVYRLSEDGSTIAGVEGAGSGLGLAVADEVVPAGSPVPGWRAGGGGSGRSASRLYQAVGT